MTMPVVHLVTGFDKATERLAHEYEVPAELIIDARRAAEANPDWRTAPGAFPLDVHAARAIGAVLKETLNVDRYDWFLEPVAVP